MRHGQLPAAQKQCGDAAVPPRESFTRMGGSYLPCLALYCIAEDDRLDAPAARKIGGGLERAGRGSNDPCLGPGKAWISRADLRPLLQEQLPDGWRWLDAPILQDLQRFRR